MRKLPAAGPKRTRVSSPMLLLLLKGQKRWLTNSVFCVFTYARVGHCRRGMLT
jgi:hypothetical protein